MGYDTIASLLRQCEGSAARLPQIVLENEMRLTGRAENEIYAELEARYAVMVQSAKKALDEPQKMVCGLIEGQAMRQQQYAAAQGGISGAFLNRVMALALSGSEVNASIGRICAAPTAGSCGILPAVLLGLAERDSIAPAKTLDAMLIAGGIGAIITKNATVAGAEGGCQAECGTAAAMAASAAAWLFGGTPEQVASAAAIALIHVMGLVCDPVAGLVQLPCSFRNASGAVNALISADLALAGQMPGIPPDEVVEAMYRVGRKLPMELRETALGGMAAEPSARAIAKELLNRREPKNQ